MTNLTKNQLEWIETLESGEFEQHRGSIGVWDQKKNKPNLCCLGVANYKFDKDSMHVEVGKIFFKDEYGLNDATLTVEAQRHINLPDTMPIIEDEKEINEYLEFIDNIKPLSEIDYTLGLSDKNVTKLRVIDPALMNDKAFFNFKEISSVLRRFPHLYFKQKEYETCS